MIYYRLGWTTRGEREKRATEREAFKNGSAKNSSRALTLRGSRAQVTQSYTHLWHERLLKTFRHPSWKGRFAMRLESSVYHRFSLPPISPSIPFAHRMLSAEWDGNGIDSLYSSNSRRYGTGVGWISYRGRNCRPATCSIVRQSQFEYVSGWVSHPFAFSFTFYRRHFSSATAQQGFPNLPVSILLRKYSLLLRFAWQNPSESATNEKMDVSRPH